MLFAHAYTDGALNGVLVHAQNKRTYTHTHTQMMSALQLCGASLDDYLHLLIPPIVKMFENSTNPVEVRK